MITVDDPILARLIGELQGDDARVVAADLELREARARFEVASKKYAVLRDIVANRLGCSPYAKPLYTDYGSNVVEFMSGGKYRFMHMDLGDAVFTVLIEAGAPMTLEELADVLNEGGANYPYAVPLRTLNATVMRKSGVGKTEDGRYFLEIGEETGVPAEIE
jgi:hypothetical protein